jgi:hypothetical protein
MSAGDARILTAERAAAEGKVTGEGFCLQKRAGDSLIHPGLAVESLVLGRPTRAF